MKIWSKGKRERKLRFAKRLDRWAARIRADVKAHTPKRAPKPRLVEAA